MSLRLIDIGDRATVVTHPGPAPILQWVRVDQLVIVYANRRLARHGFAITAGRGYRNGYRVERLA